MRMGQYPGSVPAYPYTPGCDIAGVVEALGKQATQFAVGTRVAAWSAWAATQSSSACRRRT